MADSRRLLLELIDDLLVVAREAGCETRSLGRLVASLCRLEIGKAQSAEAYLKERGFLGHAMRLTQDVERLRQKADEAFRGPFVASPTPDDRKQEQRCLASLHAEAHGLLQFLNDLKPLVEKDDDAVTAAEQVKPPATGQGQTTTGDDPLLTHTELATRYKLDREAARKQLDRWRAKNGDGWIEATDRRPNEPKYLYRLSAVRTLFERT